MPEHVLRGDPEIPRIYLIKRIVQAKIFIDGHFADAIDLDNISGEACFSKYHFIRLFKSVYGKTPHQYLIRVRIEKAKDLLNLGKSITETCFEVGFDSLGSFSALFKKLTGASPSRFRKAALQRLENIKRAPLDFVPNCFAEQHGWTQNSNFREASDP